MSATRDEAFAAARLMLARTIPNGWALSVVGSDEAGWKVMMYLTSRKD